MMGKLHTTALCAAGMFMLAACSKGEDTSRETLGDETGEGITTSRPDTGDGDGDDEPPMTSGSFVPDDVLGTPSCDVWTQDCPDDEKCVAWSSMGDTWDANKCVSILGTGRTGDECSSDGAAQGTDTCDVGFMCYYVNADGIGSCVPLCSGSPDTPMCPDAFNCSVSNDGSLPLCVYRCDPVLQDCQQEGAGCFWDGSKFNCDPAGVLLENEACAYINDCAPGHLCLEAMSLPECVGSACCSSFCELDDPQCQLDGTECIAFFDQGTAPPGLENTGVCALPGS
jgi:hypothetical protein